MVVEGYIFGIGISVMGYYVDVYLRNKNTGESAVYQPDFEYEDPFNAFMWRDDDYACDCNRSLFLYGYDESRALPCGRTIEVVKIVRRDTGEVVYRDDNSAEDARARARIIDEFMNK